jgi:hypothetical protein
MIQTISNTATSCVCGGGNCVLILSSKYKEAADCTCTLDCCGLNSYTTQKSMLCVIEEQFVISTACWSIDLS